MKQLKGELLNFVILGCLVAVLAIFYIGIGLTIFDKFSKGDAFDWTSPIDLLFLAGWPIVMAVIVGGGYIVFVVAVFCLGIVVAVLGRPFTKLSGKQEVIPMRVVTWYGMAENPTSSSYEALREAEIALLRAGGIAEEEIAKVKWMGVRMSNGIPIFTASPPEEIMEFIKLNSANDVINL